jgi:hypothetical protein
LCRQLHKHVRQHAATPAALSIWPRSSGKEPR